MQTIKIFKQETNISCGIACLRSIFAFYGKELTEKEILDANQFYNDKPNHVINPLISLAVTAKKFGFDVKYVGFNPIIANKTNNLSLKDSLLEKQKTYVAYGKFIVDGTLELLELRGEVIIDKLNIIKLKKLIDENNFILVGVKPAFYKDIAPMMNHKLILDGYNEKGFHVLDPSGEEYYLDFDTFLMAFYAFMPEVLIINDNRKVYKLKDIVKL